MRFTVARLGVFVLALLAPSLADAALTVSPITFNVVGLDSNSPVSGPKSFPVGARVCSSVAITSVTASWVWDSANPNINLRAGSLSSIVFPAIAAGACADAYFEVEINQIAAAFDTARRYHIVATDGSASGSSPIPREIYVEHLISQSRNSVTSVELDGVSIPAGGMMALVVGGVYDITLVAATATQGYNQLESFINFPNTIFKINKVSTTYTADSSIFVSTPNDLLYADACNWQNAIASPNYRTCVGGVGGVGSDGKAGGGVTTTYTVQILAAGAGTTQTLNTLIYDFSGSSYHYNGDYAVGARFAQIVSPTAPAFAKAFAPSTVLAGGTSVLTFTIGNANPGALTNVGFTDGLPSSPAQLVIANSPAATSSGCGTATLTATPAASTITLAGATVAANSTCTISVPVRAPAAPLVGTYANTTGPLSVNGTATGLTASSTLTVASAPAGTGVCGLTVAQWDFGTVAAPTLTVSTVGAGVGTATIAAGNGLTTASDTTQGSPAASSMRMYGWQNAGPINTATSAYVEFAIDTDSYTGVVLQFNARRSNPGPSTSEIWYSTNGGTSWTQKATFNATTAWAAYGPYDFTGQTNASGTTLFRIYGFGANNQNSSS